MATPAWTVITWPEVFATVEQLGNALQHMQPLDTSSDGASGAGRQGQALWGGCINGRHVGIAWDWAEVTKSVVAMSDPMKVLTNLVLMDDQGCILDDGASVLQLNGAIHELPWQDVVLSSAANAAQRVSPAPQRLAA
jgi:hypothetical protein